MSALVTVRITCDTCENFKVMEAESITTARKMLKPWGWRVVLKPGGCAYGDKCPDCPDTGERAAWRYGT